jgi:hypothetical protein
MSLSSKSARLAVVTMAMRACGDSCNAAVRDPVARGPPPHQAGLPACAEASGPTGRYPGARSFALLPDRLLTFRRVRAVRLHGRPGPCLHADQESSDSMWTEG